jgi:hypothetical protein
MMGGAGIALGSVIRASLARIFGPWWAKQDVRWLIWGLVAFVICFPIIIAIVRPGS